MVSKCSGRRRESRVSTANCGYKMAVSVTGPTAKLGGPVMPGIGGHEKFLLCYLISIQCRKNMESSI